LTKQTQCPACGKKQTYSRSFIRGLPGGLDPDGRLKCRCGYRFYPDEHLSDTQEGVPLWPIVERQS
jgi:hypothetical protein